jgi:hypothetical protein
MDHAALDHAHRSVRPRGRSSGRTHHTGRRRLMLPAVALGVVALAATGGPAADAVAAPVAPAVANHVRGIPAPWTPSIATSGTDGSTETVRQMVKCGNTMYAVGKFTQIRQNGVVSLRGDAFAFSATNGALTAFRPDTDGVINSVALSADCSVAYLGGIFTSVKGVAAKNFAAVSTANGALISTIGHNAAGQVSTIVRVGSHLIVGGYFTGINGSTKKYLVSLSPTTGKDDGYVNLPISGSYSFTDFMGRHSAQNATRVYNTSLSPDGTRLLTMGVFTSVAGQGRRQAFVLDLGSTSTTLDAWYSNELNANCGVSQPFYVQDGAWSPDGSSIYLATTGTKPATGPGSKSSDPRAGLCDAVAAFPSSRGLVSHKWVNYTGCDSLFSVAADSITVYVGGHERWANNPHGCGVAGPGAADAPGMGGMSAANGLLDFNPTRARGVGADDMLLTPQGLWISSDNGSGASQCGGVAGHAGICFLPY